MFLSFGTKRILTRTVPSVRQFSKARVAVVGSGRMGQIRAGIASASPKLELVGIVDPDWDQGKDLADKVETQAFGTLHDAIAHGNLDGVIVSSPTFTHSEVIRTAADHKLAIFTEKPIAATGTEIAALDEYAAGSRLCCSFQRRFDKSYVAGMEAVQSGRIGTPVSASIFFGDHPVPKREFLLQGGNIFMDLSAHDVDYIVNVLQDDVVSVYAVGSSSDVELEAARVHDNATMVLNFSRGTTVTLFMSRSAVYGYDQRCEIFGTHGHVKIGNVQEHTAVISDVQGVHSARLEHSFPERFQEAFRSELETFADVILEGAAWPVSIEQCIAVQKIADAAKLSAETGEVVPIEHGSHLIGGTDRVAAAGI